MDSRRVISADGIRLYVGVEGAGPDVVVLSGGPGCVQYLEDAALAPRGMRAWFPEPRGVGRSEGGPHGLTEAVADLEAIRTNAAIDSWVSVDSDPAVHRSLLDAYVSWIHEPQLLRRLAETGVLMIFVAAELDIRPSWPLQQLAALVPHGDLVTVPGVPHDFWSTHPVVWADVVTALCQP